MTAEQLQEDTPKMPEVVYEKLGEKEDWDEEMYRLVDEKVVDIQYGR